MPEPEIAEAEFPDEQIHAVLRSVGDDARRAAFARGLPVYFIREKCIVARYEDGHEAIIESISEGTHRSNRTE